VPQQQLRDPEARDDGTDEAQPAGGLLEEVLRQTARG
jgi:hypothetical protein